MKIKRFIVVIDKTIAEMLLKEYQKRRAKPRLKRIKRI